MIELDVIAYLDADAQLTALLGASASDSKIYPIQKPLSSSIPYIVYNIASEGTNEENLLEMIISFECVDDVYKDLINISDRLYELLDIQDDAQNKIDSSDYYIYWCKVTSGRETKDTEIYNFHKTLDVSIKYHRKSRW